MKKTIKIISLIILTPIVIGYCWVLFIIATELNLHVGMYEDLQEQLGFTWGTPRLDNGEEVLIFGNVKEDGLMYKAGFRTDDLHDPTISVMDFTNSFIFHQNEEIIIPILRDKEQLEIPFTVPTLDLDVDLYDLHYPFTKYKHN